MRTQPQNMIVKSGQPIALSRKKIDPKELTAWFDSAFLPEINLGISLLLPFSDDFKFGWPCSLIQMGMHSSERPIIVMFQKTPLSITLLFRKPIVLINNPKLTFTTNTWDLWIMIHRASSEREMRKIQIVRGDIHKNSSVIEPTQQWASVTSNGTVFSYFNDLSKKLAVSEEDKESWDR